MRRIEVRSQPRQQKQDPISKKKNPTQKRAGRVAQVTVPACLPSKHEALSSTPSKHKKKKGGMLYNWDFIFFTLTYVFLLLRTD
jgi:hypothetical protein